MDNCILQSVSIRFFSECSGNIQYCRITGNQGFAISMKVALPLNIHSNKKGNLKSRDN
jgi:hypothetical protein